VGASRLGLSGAGQRLPELPRPERAVFADFRVQLPAAALFPSSFPALNKSEMITIPGLRIRHAIVFRSILR
jgi:hypothetical protein